MDTQKLALEYKYFGLEPFNSFDRTPTFDEASEGRQYGFGRKNN